jgi:hypothetical protein
MKTGSKLEHPELPASTSFLGISSTLVLLSHEAANEQKPRAHAMTPASSPRPFSFNISSSFSAPQPTREPVYTLHSRSSRRVTTTSIVRTDRHLQYLDVTPPLGLALNQLVQRLERTGLHEPHSLPLGAHGILALDVLHQPEYRVLDRARRLFFSGLRFRRCLGCLLEHVCRTRNAQFHLHARHRNRLMCNQRLHREQSL